MTLMDRFVEKFSEIMSNRALAIVIMLFAAAGAVCTIAGGYYGTYKVITTLSNDF